MKTIQKDTFDDYVSLHLDIPGDTRLNDFLRGMKALGKELGYEFELHLVPIKKRPHVK